MKRFFALFISLVVLVSCVSVTRAEASGGDPVAEIIETGITYGTVQAAINAAANGQTVKMIADSTENVQVGTNTDRSKVVTLDLNGKTLTSTGTVEGIRYNAITNYATLTIADSSADKTGKITGGTGSVKGKGSYGGGVYNSEGTLTMTGGTITGNSAGIGGGVANIKGTFTMTGGTITGNTSTTIGGGGVVNLDGGIFIMTGGSITGNTAVGTGGGVYNDATMKVSGTAKVTDNTKGTGETATTNNVYLTAGKVITVGTGSGTIKYLESGALIGVTTASTPVEGTPVDITGANSADYSSYFSSDNTAYSVINDGTGSAQIVKLAVHTHSWTYKDHAADASVSADTIKAVCGCTVGTCSITATTLTIQKPTLTTYGETGKSENATLSATTLGGLTVSADNIKYYAKTADGTGWETTPLTAAPVKAGTYKASITVGSGADARTASVEYTIEKKAVTITADDKSMKLGETVPKFTAKVEGLIGTDEITYVFNTLAPTAQGVYSIVPTVTGGADNYAVTCVPGSLAVSTDTADVKANPANVKAVFTQFSGKTEYSGKQLDVEIRTGGEVPQSDKTLITGTVGTKKKVVYTDTDLMLIIKTSTGTTEENIGDKNDTLIAIVYKFDFSQKDKVQVYRVHTAAGETAKVEELTKTPNTAGEYVAYDTTAGTITVYAKKYSTYAFVYEDVEAPAPPTGDSNHMALYIAIMALALMGLAALICFRRKESK